MSKLIGDEAERQMREIARQVLYSEVPTLRVQRRQHFPAQKPNFLEYSGSYCIDETYTESGISKHRWNTQAGAHDSLAFYDDYIYDGAGSIRGNNDASIFFNRVQGSESGVGITHDTSETDPHTNCNFEITRDGHYKFALTVPLAITIVDDNPNNSTTYTSTTTSGHTHNVTVNETEYNHGPTFDIRLSRKDDNGGLGSDDTQSYVDEEGNFRRFARSYYRPWGAVSGAGIQDVVLWEITANLDAGDRIAFRFSAFDLAKYNDYSSLITIADSRTINLRVENLGPKRDFTAI